MQSRVRWGIIGTANIARTALIPAIKASRNGIVLGVASRDMVYYLNFFDQFARSHSLWSPDGRYVVYGASDTLGQPSVLLVDTRNPGQPIKVATGTFGVWSWNSD